MDEGLLMAAGPTAPCDSDLPFTRKALSAHPTHLLLWFIRSLTQIHLLSSLLFFPLRLRSYQCQLQMATARVIPAAATSCFLSKTPFLRRIGPNTLCFNRNKLVSSSSRRLFTCSAIYNPQVQIKEEGKPETLDYRVFLVNNSSKKVSGFLHFASNSFARRG